MYVCTCLTGLSPLTAATVSALSYSLCQCECSAAGTEADRRKAAGPVSCYAAAAAVMCVLQHMCTQSIDEYAGCAKHEESREATGQLS